MELNSSGKKHMNKVNKIFIMSNRHKLKGRLKQRMGNFDREREIQTDR